ncbi:SelT-like protein [Camellia lanceoleosa]|uniref:SelT-like protein n=1 Tax=Camellia lanceoleosa TaxID=1840588 RepID=A0ACC0F3U3_9ERIC|nr:SelT-like protein [Camellia lanceoleosa]
MLETSFPGIDVVLANYPPPLPKRVLSKLVPAVQMGVIGITMAAEQIFPMLGFMVPPPWYYSLRANRFGSIATTWLLGNVLQNFLQSTGAFEVYLNDEPVSVSALHQISSFDFYWNEIYSAVFSKLKKGRFPDEIEWKDLINKKLANPQVLHNYQVMWS